MQPGYTANTEQPNRNEWIECPKCRSVMLLLSEYEIQSSSEFPGIETELWDFLAFGWMAFVYNFAIGLLGFGGQKVKLAKKKKELLPAFPNSLVCPRCFFVQTRF